MIFFIFILTNNLIFLPIYPIFEWLLLDQEANRHHNYLFLRFFVDILDSNQRLKPWWIEMNLNLNLKMLKSLWIEKSVILFRGRAICLIVCLKDSRPTWSWTWRAALRTVSGSSPANCTMRGRSNLMASFVRFSEILFLYLLYII